LALFGGRLNLGMWRGQRIGCWLPQSFSICLR
jgi:hypothetical protein